MKDPKTGKTLKRNKAVETTNGIIFTSTNGKMWQIDYPTPEPSGRYGNASFERVAMFFLLIGRGHTLDDADRIAFQESKIRSRTKK
ncbi:MAG: hypothetical protein WAX07_08980 [Candidatus Altiarchaeia archaeon]